VGVEKPDAGWFAVDSTPGHESACLSLRTEELGELHHGLLGRVAIDSKRFALALALAVSELQIDPLLGWVLDLHILSVPQEPEVRKWISNNFLRNFIYAAQQDKTETVQSDAPQGSDPTSRRSMAP